MSAARVRELARAMLLGFSRDRSALFFTIVFPLLFLVVFTLVLDGGGASRVQVYVAGDGALVRTLPADALDVEPVASVEDGLARVRHGDRPALVYEDGDRVVVRFAASDAIGGATVRSIVAAVVADANVRAASGGAPPRYALEASQVEDASLTPVELLAPGMLGWAISISGVFGVALTLVDWRTKGLLRRLRLAPLTTLELASARLLMSLAVALLQTVVFLAVAIGLLGLEPAGTWLLAVPLVLLGTLAFIPLGLIIGALTRSVEGASAFAQLVTLPMAFLSGAFFQLDDAPGWVQAISRALPLRHLLDALTDVMVRGLGPADVVGDTAFIVGFAAVGAAIAVRLVRLDEE